MRATIALAHVATVVALVGCQAAPPTFSAQDEATLSGMFDATVTNIKAGDWVTWSRQFSETAVLQPPNAPSVIGRPAILAWGQAFPQIEDLSFANVQVFGVGDMAYGTSSYRLKVAGAPVDSGKQLVVFRRSAAGTWEIPAVSFSSDVPLPAPAPTRGARRD